MESEIPAYGLWMAVIINSAIFIIFAFSFTRPKTARDWRSLGAFSAFMVALFTEMYGFPLTIYLLSGWLSSNYPGVDLFSHEAGHLWWTVSGQNGDPHFALPHLLSGILVVIGFIILAKAWRKLHTAQRNHTLAITGLYARIRHPQYLAFIIILLSFLIQWPTILTLMMFPVLVFMYVNLAKAEEREALREFGEEYENYARRTPRFVPRFNNFVEGPAESGP